MCIILNNVKDLFQILQAGVLNINLICLKLLLCLLWLYLIEAILYYTQKCENYVISINKSAITPLFGLMNFTLSDFYVFQTLLFLR